MKVAIGVIFDQEHRILIAKRPLGKAYAGFWEFPGGKVNENESPENALVREIKEEVDLDITSNAYWTDVVYEQDNKQITLMVYAIHQFEGIPQPKEDQPDIRWITPNDIDSYQFPPANATIIRLIKNSLSHHDLAILI